MTLNDGLVQTREADTGDRATPVVALNYDFDSNTGKWGPRAAGSSGGTGGTSASLVTLSMVTLAMDGTSKSLPTAPAGATALDMQPQGGDVRVTTDASAASASNGLIYYEGGIYPHPFGDRAATRVFGVLVDPAITVVLIWKGPA